MRKIAFVLASTDHGTLIVNRLDYRLTGADSGFGVGYRLMETGGYEKEESTVAMQALELRRQHFGDGVVAVDCGANIGVHTVEWANRMTGWGTVVAFEPQERLYYALAGNIAIANAFNAHAVQAAVGAQNGEMQIPKPNYLVPGSFGSLELRQHPETEYIGQKINYEENLTSVRLMTLDSLNLSRLDLLKIDVERMEVEVLIGADDTIRRLQPIIIVERMKHPENTITDRLDALGYDWLAMGLNVIAIHPNDPVHQHLARTTSERGA